MVGRYLATAVPFARHQDSSEERATRAILRAARVNAGWTHGEADAQRKARAGA
jgi:hypothetical protein